MINLFNGGRTLTDISLCAFCFCFSIRFVCCIVNFQCNPFTSFIVAAKRRMTTHTRTHLLLVKWKWRTGKVFAELKCVASFTWFCNCCCHRRRRHWSCLFICSYRSARAHSMWLYCNWCCSVCGACILFRIIVIGWHHKMQMAATTLLHFPLFFLLVK